MLNWVRAANLEQLIQHGLHALRETLQQDKELTIHNTSIGIVGPSGEFEQDVPEEGSFRLLEGESVDVYIKALPPKEVPAPAAQGGQPPTAGDEDVQMAG